MTRRLLAVSLIVVVAALAFWPADVRAQGREGGGGQGSVVVVAPQRTVVYPPWYGPYGGGWGWGYPYPYPYPYPFFGYGYDNSPQLRTQVTPRETEVYVDGARAGIVDDYDGIFQRLHLTPGEHEITLYLAGFRSWSERRYFAPHSDDRILHTMLQLAPGQPDEPRPVPPPREMGREWGDDRREPPEPRNPPPPDQPRNPPPPSQPREPRTPDQPRNPPPPDRPQPDRSQPDRSQNAARGFGTLSVGIQPAGADVLVDGQKQPTVPGQDRLIIQLPEGVHRLVIQKTGFQTWETDLQIRRGRTLAFDVTLMK